MGQKNIIIDCDPGHDDAVALILLIAAHKKKEIDIKAITCVVGNTDVDNGVKNIFRTLEACDSLDIPVYKGAHSRLISLEGSVKLRFHGNDGFGDLFKNDPDISKLQKKHAVIAIHDIIKNNPNEIIVVCLAPLTNIALTIKLFPEVLNDVREFYVMGGNSKGVGNVTSHAEFNFYEDPESAHILFNNNYKPLWLLPWETCFESSIRQVEWRDNILGKINSKPMMLINSIEKAIFSIKPTSEYYVTCDASLAGVLLNPDMIKQCTKHHADIELSGFKSRGQLLLDHMQIYEAPNIFLIDKIDFDVFKELMYKALESFCQ